MESQQASFSMLAQRASAPIGIRTQQPSPPPEEEEVPSRVSSSSRRHPNHHNHHQHNSSEDEHFQSQNSLSARSMTSTATSIDVDRTGKATDEQYQRSSGPSRSGHKGSISSNGNSLDDEFYFGESGWTRSPKQGDPLKPSMSPSKLEPLFIGQNSHLDGYFGSLAEETFETNTNSVKALKQMSMSVCESHHIARSPILSPSRTAMYANGDANGGYSRSPPSVNRLRSSRTSSTGSLSSESASQSPLHQNQQFQTNSHTNQSFSDNQSHRGLLSSSSSRKSSFASLHSPGSDSVPIRLGKPRRSNTRISTHSQQQQQPNQRQTRAISDLYDSQPKHPLMRSGTDTTMSTDIDLYDTASEGPEPNWSDEHRSSASSSSHDDTSGSGSAGESSSGSPVRKSGRDIRALEASGTGTALGMGYVEASSVSDEPIIVFPGRQHTRNASESTTTDQQVSFPAISVNTELGGPAGPATDSDLETPIAKQQPYFMCSDISSELRDIVPENGLNTSFPNISHDRLSVSSSIESPRSRSRSPCGHGNLSYNKVRNVSGTPSPSALPASISSPQLSLKNSTSGLTVIATRSHSTNSLMLSTGGAGRSSPAPGNQVARNPSPVPGVHLVRSQSASNAFPNKAASPPGTDQPENARYNSGKSKNDNKRSPISPGAMFSHFHVSGGAATGTQVRPVRPSLSTSLGEKEKEGLGLGVSSGRRASMYSHRTSFSLSRRRNTATNAGITPGTPVDDSTSEEIERLREAIAAQRELKRKRKEFMDGDKVLVGTKVSEGHVNYVTAYNMLTGIRVSVSRCTAKINRELRDEDFTAKQKLAFDISGNELTPYAKYDFKFKDYAPWVFRHLREQFKLDPADYLVSLTSKYIVSELGSPGKSGSFFYFSRDFRFIIKTIHHSEHKMLRKILKDYYNHVQNNPNTLISQFYGLHRVKLPFGRKIHFVVMNNLFPPHRDIHRTFDLKGSTLGRRFTHPKPGSVSSGKRQIVYKDEDFLEQNESIQLGPKKREQFLKQLEIDVELLKRLHIMDYSLLIGVHDLAKGNTENIRDTTLQIFEPSAVASMSKVKIAELRKALVSASPMSINELSVVLDEYQREDFLFYADNGGFRASDENDEPINEIYYLGVIDCLTPYTFFKRAETFWKGLSNPRGSISAVPPVEYGDRFFKFIRGLVGAKSRNPRQSLTNANEGQTQGQGAGPSHSDDHEEQTSQT